VKTIAILLLVATQGLAGEEAAPRLRIETPEMDCGGVFRGTVLRRTFRVHNDGTARLVLEKVRPS